MLSWLVGLIAALVLLITSRTEQLAWNSALSFLSNDYYAQQDDQLESVTATTRQNATFLTLCRNEDLYDMLRTVQSIEDRFNSRYHYDWVFLNDKEFTEEFKEAITAMVSSEHVKFGQVKQEHWGVPAWIDQQTMFRNMESLKSLDVIYGDSLSYRKMCRWFSGFFQWHELVMPYKYYWRVEPGVEYSCDINYDPFAEMAEKQYRYGFVISILEYYMTIPSLFQSVVEFFTSRGEDGDIVARDNTHEFILESDGAYNLCHFWTNFEIGDLDLFRSDEYTEYFNHLDNKGGFFYERWGDGPVRSIFISLTVPSHEINWFQDIGYEHPPYQSCPCDAETRLANRCSCDPTQDFTSHDYSCTPRFLNAQRLRNHNEANIS